MFRVDTSYEPIRQDEDEFGRSSKKAGRAWSLALFSLFVVLSLALIVARTTSTTIRFEDEADHRRQGYLCENFDDDIVYTNTTCAMEDRSACDFYCSSGWCAELCGDDCRGGSGAVCAVSYLDAIWDTCATVHFKKKIDFPFTTYGNGSLDSSEASACDHHLYCRFCDETCRSLLVAFGWGQYEDSLNVGPHSMLLLNNLTEICSQLDDLALSHDHP